MNIASLISVVVGSFSLVLAGNMHFLTSRQNTAGGNVINCTVCIFQGLLASLGYIAISEIITGNWIYVIIIVCTAAFIHRCIYTRSVLQPGFYKFFSVVECLLYIANVTALFGHFYKSPDIDAFNNLETFNSIIVYFGEYIDTGLKMYFIPIDDYSIRNPHFIQRAFNIVICVCVFDVIRKILKDTISPQSADNAKLGGD